MPSFDVYACIYQIFVVPLQAVFAARVCCALARMRDKVE